jgi:Glycosyltransferase
MAVILYNDVISIFKLFKNLFVSFIMSHLAFVFPSEVFGGHELMAINIIKKWQLMYDCHIDIYISSNNIRLIDKLNAEKINYKFHPIVHRRFYIYHSMFNVYMIFTALRFISKINKQYNKIVVVQGDIENGAVFLLAGWILNVNITSYIPYFHSFRKMGARWSLLKDALSFLVYNSCKEYWTISNCFCNDLKKINHQAHCSVVENFIDIPDNYVSYQKGNDEPLKLFVIGRVYFKQKGHDILINALKILDSFSNKNIELHFIGDGPDLKRLKEISLELPKFIKPVFHGWIDDSWSIAYQADLVIIPSRFEGVPLVMLEAMNRRVNIIAANLDGMKDYLPSTCTYAADDDVVACIELSKKLKKFIMNN